VRESNQKGGVEDEEPLDFFFFFENLVSQNSFNITRIYQWQSGTLSEMK